MKYSVSTNNSFLAKVLINIADAYERAVENTDDPNHWIGFHDDELENIASFFRVVISKAVQLDEKEMSINDYGGPGDDERYSIASDDFAHALRIAADWVELSQKGDATPIDNHFIELTGNGQKRVRFDPYRPRPIASTSAGGS